MYKSKFQLHSSKLISNSGRKKNEIIVNHENIEQGVNKDEIKIDIEENSLTDENKENTNTKQALNNITDNYSFTQFEIDNLNNEIKFAELYSITLKHYSKEIYNPCKFFFINKFQIEKLTEDLRKLLHKVCDFDEDVYKYNLEYINIYDEKRILKEIAEACNQSNHKKLKFIFSHLRINPNFIYSDVLDQITYQTIGERESNSNVINNFTINLAGGNVTGVVNNQTTLNNTGNNFVNTYGISPITHSNINFRLNHNNRLPITSNMNFKDKISNLYSFLKKFKDKNELNESLKFLIEEYNYLPIKLEAELSIDVKFGKDFEWKINLNLV